MVMVEVINKSADVLGSVVSEVGRIGLVLQALGVIVILWIVFELIALIVNRKKRKALYSIKQDLIRIEGKLDRVLDKKK